MDLVEKKYLYSSIGRRIRGFRKEHGISQEDLAEKLNKSRASIVNIEQGRQTPSLHLLIEIARELNARIDDFIPKEIMARSEKENSVKRRINLMIHDRVGDIENIESEKMIDFLISINGLK